MKPVLYVWGCVPNSVLYKRIHFFFEHLQAKQGGKALLSFFPTDREAVYLQSLLPLPDQLPGAITVTRTRGCVSCRVEQAAFLPLLQCLKAHSSSEELAAGLYASLLSLLGIVEL